MEMTENDHNETHAGCRALLVLNWFPFRYVYSINKSGGMIFQLDTGKLNR